jgi:formylglycine-generating enzyme required for sulfatase activity
LLRLVYSLTRRVDGDRGPEERLRDLLRQGVRAIGPYRRVILAKGVAQDFAWVPPGAFRMGGPEDEERAEGDEEEEQVSAEWPVHEVTLTRGLWVGTTPVTQGLFTHVTGRNPSWGSDRGPEVAPEDFDLPVQEVEWNHARRFLKRLSQQVGPRFRLPTEAEWEYACRAGTTTRFWSGDAEADLARVAWYWANTQDAYPPMRPVGRLPANAFGLYDMHGNVWEWCQDIFMGDYYTRSPREDPVCRRGDPEQRVIRGGDAWDDAGDCRSARRDDYHADCSHNDIGFRAVADRLEPPEP